MAWSPDTDDVLRYLVAIATDSYQTCAKMYLRVYVRLLKTAGAKEFFF